MSKVSPRLEKPPGIAESKNKKESKQEWQRLQYWWKPL